MHAGSVYAAQNWSLGGFLLDAAPAIDVGGRLTGQLQVAGRNDSFLVTAEAVRRDRKAGTLGCRFVDPSPAMMTALDRAVMARLSARRPGPRRLALGAATLVLSTLVAWPALSAGTGTPGSGTLVPGGAPLPEFRLDFPRFMDGFGEPGIESRDLDITLTSPDRGVLDFLFSPRSQFAMDTDPGTGTSRSAAGLTWNLFDSDGFYGNLGFTGSMVHPGAEEMYRRALGPPLALHSTFQFGYMLGSQHSLMLSLDHASTPDFYNDRGEFNNFTLRYGLRF